MRHSYWNWIAAVFLPPCFVRVQKKRQREECEQRAIGIAREILDSPSSSHLLIWSRNNVARPPFPPSFLPSFRRRQKERTPLAGSVGRSVACRHR